MVGSAFPDLHYIDLTDPQNPVVADRPANSALIDKVTITADGVDFATISSIAVSTRAVVTATNGVVGGEYIVDDGVLELTADTPCTLTVTLTHYRELPITFTVEAI